MKRQETLIGKGANRRSFLKKGAFGAGAAAVTAGLLPGSLTAFGQTQDDGAPITKGDIAILTFLSALEQVEADLWIQYAELGGPDPNQWPVPRVSPRSICSSMVNQSARGLLQITLSRFKCSTVTCLSTLPTTPTTRSAIIVFSTITCSPRARTHRPEPVCHPATESCDRCTSKRKTHQPEASDRGYEVVDPIPRRAAESRLRRQLRERGAGLG